jgi:4-amino-4-deoxy-L-arabinose transferase-like glycosyltransferase
MSDTAPRVFLYALLAGLSPLALLATLAALGSGRGRVNGTVFALAFLLAQAIVLVIAFFLGSAAAPDDGDAQGRAFASLELALGLLLLVFALRGLAGRASSEPERSRTKAVLTRLRGLRPATAFSIGALLGIGGIKRLTVTLVTGATIAISSLERSEGPGLLSCTSSWRRCSSGFPLRSISSRARVPTARRRARSPGSFGTNGPSRRPQCSSSAPR